MLCVTAVTHVLGAWTPVPLQQFTSTVLSGGVRQCLDALYKTKVARLMAHYCSEVGERLGAQGTFVHHMVGLLEASPMSRLLGVHSHPS